MKENRKFKPYTALGLLFVHLVAIFGFWYWHKYGFSINAWIAFSVFEPLSLSGISIVHHRLFMHKSFQANNFIKYMGAVLGGMAAQKDLSDWIKTHHQHHAFTDQKGDPHSPSEFKNKLMGFLWSHVGWTMFDIQTPHGYKSPRWIDEDPIIAWQKQWYNFIVVSGFLVPTLLAGIDGLLLAGFIRVVIGWHTTWSVNSICHMFGFKSKEGDNVFDTRGARNIPLLALIGIGEHYHGNHHARQNCAYLGWKWYDLDSGKWIIILLEYINKLGGVKLVWDVKKPKDFLSYDKRLNA